MSCWCDVLTVLSTQEPSLSSVCTNLMMLVHHTDPVREYAYGPAGGLPNTGIGVFTDALLEEANTRGWFVIDMKNDWKTIFGED